jgi:hypothetical protein
VSERGSQSLTASVVAGGFVMGEGPRWRGGRFWFSDIFDGHVYSVGDDGELRLEVTIDRPSGLGWLPDGSVLVATLAREVNGQLAGPARVVRVDTTGQHVVIDVTEEGNIGFNDMVVGPDGRAYVNVYRGVSAKEDEIWLVDPDGSHVSVADGLAHPNGMVITPDRGTLLACETHAHRVLAFSIDADGMLSAKRVLRGRAGDRRRSLPRRGGSGVGRLPFRRRVPSGRRGWHDHASSGRASRPVGAGTDARRPGATDALHAHRRHRPRARASGRRTRFPLPRRGRGSRRRLALAQRHPRERSARMTR